MNFLLHFEWKLRRFIMNFTPLWTAALNAFSNFIIAMAVLRVWWPAGVVLFVTGTVLCFLRVAAGVHYPKDVIVGGILGIICGGLGFFVL